MMQYVCCEEKRQRELFCWDKIPGYLFNWYAIPENDSEKTRLKKFIKKEFGKNWVDSAEINKIDDDRTIELSFENNFLFLRLNELKSKANLVIDTRTYEFIAKTEKSKLSIYIPENDNAKLIEFLSQKFGIEWVTTANIEKIDDDRTIKITNDKKFVSLKLNNEKTIVNLEIYDGRTDKFLVKTENGELNVYGILNGIEFVEVSDDQLTLSVHFTRPLSKDDLIKENIKIEGGERIRDISVTKIHRHVTNRQANVLNIKLNKIGDFSTYTLRLIPDSIDPHRLDGFDPVLRAVDFSFKVNCFNDFDCLKKRECPGEKHSIPEINYLAKDYASFKQLMLDRISALVPDWKERNIADAGIALVELLAYVGDYLSYQQDAIATEAYLGTARSRISIRRHARLVDYFMHNGCNARVWVQVKVNADITLPLHTRLLTHTEDQPEMILAFDQAMTRESEVFETMHTAKLFYEQNEFHFYTWCANECCLPKKTTHAILKGHFPNLKAGDVLVFTEVISPGTGKKEDADPSHRHAVRLTNAVTIDREYIFRWDNVPDNNENKNEENKLKEFLKENYKMYVTHFEKSLDERTISISNGSHSISIILNDEKRKATEATLRIDKEEYVFTAIIENGRLNIYHDKKLTDPLNGQPITQIEWHAKDALPFPFCISAEIDEEGNKKNIENVSIALGNIVLADHGLTIDDLEALGEVPAPKLSRVYLKGDRCEDRKITKVPPRYNPHLKEKNLTFAIPYNEKFLFSINFEPKYQHDLDRKNFSMGLQQQFANRIKFDNNKISIQGTTDEWSLSDGEKVYIIRKEKEKKEKEILKIYEWSESANETMNNDVLKALPAIRLKSKSKPGDKIDEWEPKCDLLESKDNDHHFVVETETDGTAYLRFGDCQHGSHPDQGAKFFAAYRRGNGKGGNIGANTIVQISGVALEISEAVIGVCNPLPGGGGIEAESIEDVKQKAPYAFRRQERAVTPEDYAEMAEKYPKVQQTAPTFRWTGSWHTVYATIDRMAGLPVDEDYKKKMREHLEKYRMAGHDIEIDGPRYVSMEIEMQVCVKPDYFKSDIKDALLEMFNNRDLPDGRRGVFHPDNFTFGQTVYLSPLFKAAQEIDGVAWVQITRFQRLGIDNNDALDAGKLILGRLEIARLDNDPNYPENGIIRFNMEGGK